MLLRNESKVRHFVEINLTYDDKAKKELIVHEGDCVDISYRRNGRVAVGSGKIKNIIVKQYTKSNGFGTGETAILEIDMSSNCKAETDEINIRDIIDINLKTDNEATYPDMDDEIDPGFGVHQCHRVAAVGMPVTPGGVVKND